MQATERSTAQVLASWQAYKSRGFRFPMLLLGSAQWTRQQASAWLQRMALEREVVWCSQQPPAQSLQLPSARLNHQLGRDLSAAVVDFHAPLSINALAAVAGAVVGGGVVIFLGATTVFEQTPFLKRLYTLLCTSGAFCIIEEDGVGNLPSLPNQEPVFSASSALEDQRQVVVALKRFIESGSDGIVLLEADRGRGKSAAIGMGLSEAESGATQVVVTAPRKGAIDTLSRFAGEREVPLRFFAPDHFLTAQPNAELLLIDEAAAIPPRLIRPLLSQYQKVILATTVQGYEGTGNGFQIRLKQLLEQFSYQQLSLSHPIRWQQGDPLEQWLDQVFIFKPSFDRRELSLPPINDMSVQRFQFKNTVSSEAELVQIYDLLSAAHYRTQPSDLQLLLDSPDLMTFTVYCREILVAVAMVSQEGPLPADVHDAIMAGKRRPKGHRLPQSMAVHGFKPEALAAHCWRVVRIAVRQEFQGQGIGAKLLTQIRQQAQHAGVDVVGTMFSANARVVSFWQQNQYQLLRMGYVRDSTTGDYSALMAHGLSPKGIALVGEMATDFGRDLPLQLLELQRTLEAELVVHLIATVPLTVVSEQQDQLRFQHYSAGYTPYENVAVALWRLCLAHAQQIDWSAIHSDQRHLIILKVLQKQSWESCCKALHLTGQKQARYLLQQGLIHALNNLELQDP